MNQIPSKHEISYPWLRQLTTEIYKILTDLSLQFIKPIFTVKELPYDLRNGHILNLPSARFTYCGTNSILFRAYQVWNNLPLSIKQSQICKICKICKIS